MVNYFNFLNTLKDSSNEKIIELLESAYKVIFETGEHAYIPNTTDTERIIRYTDNDAVAFIYYFD